MEDLNKQEAETRKSFIIKLTGDLLISTFTAKKLVPLGQLLSSIPEGHSNPELMMQKHLIETILDLSSLSFIYTGAMIKSGLFTKQELLDAIPLAVKPDAPEGTAETGVKILSEAIDVAIDLSINLANQSN